ncbi:LysR family transcriptional regulator [Janibacter melonis]|uniref:LysR family transcriptional regulator n=1 Tax=Janibacter melonis TaxID=262209 RepID=A0A5P8FRJ4_9MICO|nr:LysR family transcriptional regulator [Janibacter melonis]QFQ31452.1 LysR family transcriptional regulator [Janibacter melonis]
MLDVSRLQVLLHVIEEGSVTAAAARLQYSPSAVSQQLRRLEREVGQPLLTRHARGMVPTEAGQVLAGHARKVVRQLTAAEADLAEIAGLRRGQLSIGTFATVGSSFVPLAVQRFRQLYPSIRMHIHSDREQGLIDKLEEGEVGLSLLWDYEWRRIDPSQVALTTLFEDPTVLVVAADHPLAGERSVHMRDLADEGWIIRSEQHPVVEVLHRSAAAAGFEPRISFEANDYQEAQAMVSVGFGVALAPRTALTNKHPGVRIVSLGDSAPPRRIVVAHRHDRVRAPAEIAFHEVLLDMAQGYEPD